MKKHTFLAIFGHFLGSGQKSMIFEWFSVRENRVRFFDVFCPFLIIFDKNLPKVVQKWSKNGSFLGGHFWPTLVPLLYGSVKNVNFHKILKRKHVWVNFSKIPKNHFLQGFFPISPKIHFWLKTWTHFWTPFLTIPLPYRPLSEKSPKKGSKNGTFLQLTFWPHFGPILGRFWIKLINWLFILFLLHGPVSIFAKSDYFCQKCQKMGFFRVFYEKTRKKRVFWSFFDFFRKFSVLKKTESFFQKSAPQPKFFRFWTGPGQNRSKTRISQNTPKIDHFWPFLDTRGPEIDQKWVHFW